jgi:hypothetical protein
MFKTSFPNWRYVEKLAFFSQIYVKKTAFFVWRYVEKSAFFIKTLDFFEFFKTHCSQSDKFDSSCQLRSVFINLNFNRYSYF